MGKSYVVEEQAGAVEIRNPAGQKIPHGEEMLIQRQVDDEFFMGMTDSFSRVIPTGKPVKVGTTIDFSNELGWRLLELGDQTQFKFSKKVMTLKGTRVVGGKTCGVFQVELVGRSDDKGGPQQMSLTLRGEVLIEVDTTRMRQSDLKGDLKSNTKAKNQPRFDGSVRFKQAVDYPKK